MEEKTHQLFEKLQKKFTWKFFFFVFEVLGYAGLFVCYRYDCMSTYWLFYAIMLLASWNSVYSWKKVFRKLKAWRGIDDKNFRCINLN